jgi:hypothetical protein
MSVPREGLRVGSGSLPLTSEPLFTHGCHCLNCQQQTGTALVINLLIKTDRVQLLAGDNSRSRHLPTTAARSGSSMSNLSGGGLHPVRTPRTAARPWRHARPAPRAWGKPWRACSGSSRDVGSHLRSVARFQGSVCNA